VSDPAPFPTHTVVASSALLLLAACASLGTPEDEAHVHDLWERMQGYESWGQVDGWDGVLFSLDGTHGEYVQIWANGVALDDLENLPEGSIVVKEGYSDEAGEELNAITVMERREPGYDPENGDWFWGRFRADGTPTHAGRVGFCADCHASDTTGDFSFVNDDFE